MDLNNHQFAQEIANSYKVEKALTDKLNKEIKTEEEILKQSEVIAEALMNRSKLRTVVSEKDFYFTFKVQPILVKKRHKVTNEIKEIPIDHIVLIVADINKYNLSGGKYMPFVAKAEVDKNYSIKDNLKTVVEAFIRHLTGNIKPESLE